VKSLAEQLGYVVESTLVRGKITFKIDFLNKE